MGNELVCGGINSFKATSLCACPCCDGLNHLLKLFHRVSGGCRGACHFGCSLPHICHSRAYFTHSIGRLGRCPIHLLHCTSKTISGLLDITNHRSELVDHSIEFVGGTPELVLDGIEGFHHAANLILPADANVVARELHRLRQVACGDAPQCASESRNLLGSQTTRCVCHRQSTGADALRNQDTDGCLQDDKKRMDERDRPRWAILVHTVGKEDVEQNVVNSN